MMLRITHTNQSDRALECRIANCAEATDADRFVMLFSGGFVAGVLLPGQIPAALRRHLPAYAGIISTFDGIV